MRKYFLLMAVLLSVSFALSQTRQAASSNLVGKGTSGLMPDIGAPTAFSEASNLSGCLVMQNGRFWLSQSGNGNVYALEDGDLVRYEHHVVRVGGHPEANPQYSGRLLQFHVDRVSDTGEFCDPLAFERLPGLVVHGGAGREGDVFKETTTHVNATTAGSETVAGIREKKGEEPYVNEPLSIFKMPGHPPNWEMVGHSRGAASDLAASAEQTEIGAPEGTFGVQNTRPNYQNPGKSQEIGGAQSPMQSSANTVGSMQVGPNSPPNRIQGCVQQGNGHWMLMEGNRRYQLQGNVANLRGWQGHTIAANGRLRNGNAFEVSGIQDLAPTCQTR